MLRPTKITKFRAALFFILFNDDLSTTYISNGRMIINDKLGSTLKETVMTSFKVLTKDMSGGQKENHKKISEYCATRLRTASWTSQTQSRNDHLSTVIFNEDCMQTKEPKFQSTWN
jgi:hypothetical protein